MLHCVGEDALEIYNPLSIQYADAQAKKMEEVLTAFRQYCAPRKNTVFERHQFWAYKHNEEAGIDKFVTDLRLRARDCEFGESEDLMLRDKIVFSIADHRLRERLLSTADLPLHKAIDICRAKEAATMQARAMAPNSSIEEQLVHAVSNTGRFAKYAKPQPNSARVALQEEWRTRACRNCGRLHKPRQCPAYNMDCRKCGKKNHFAAVCRSNPDVALVEAEAPDVNALYIAGISRAHKGNSRDTGWSSSLRVGGTLVTFKLDTGAEANVLPLAVAEGLPMPLNMQRTDTVLVAYGGVRIQPKGVVKLLVQARRKQAQLYFFVTDASDTPLLGRQACVQLDLVRKVEALARSAPATKQDLLQQYSSVFEGLGEFPGEHHIYTDPKAPPVIHGCRRIPYSVYDRLKDTLDDLQKRGVISRVTKPTAWVSSLCITEKRNGSLRVCLDPKDLNRAILHQHFSIPTPEDVQGKLAGKTIFTILDEKDGYHQIKLDDESADLCTFNTPWGRYRFHRLPFGIKSASEVFQQTNSEAFGDIEGVSVIADDMIIAAASKTEHDSILQKVMDRAIQLNVKFNKDKIQYMVGRSDTWATSLVPLE
ncbi:hypothetical protein AAFF_G00357730 [Aldrovandia affinis]|uniref:ribonuclease H n=1 Tax=Aldrovandia affinis TaxID=143900 RepID=A0AAD7T8V1_9TELE|nr:hypothetical protein AAFF_G00357730 [Aldrovandia affinis]